MTRWIAAWALLLFSMGIATPAFSANPFVSSPSDGTQYSATSQTFSWDSNGADISAYALTIGSTEGASNVFDSGQLSASTLSQTVPNIGAIATLYIRLWFRTGDGAWGYSSSTAISGSVASSPAIYSPTAGSVLAGSTVQLDWRSNGTNVTRYWLYAGNTQGSSGYLNRSMGTATTYTLTGLPTNGSKVFVRLWYYTNRWNYKDHQYTATGGNSGGTNTSDEPEIISPAPGSLLKQSSVTLNWVDNNFNPSNYWIYIGTAQGSYNIHSSGSLGTANEYSFSGIPLGQSAIFIRLWYYSGSTGWKFTDHEYSSMLYGDPQILSPEPGALLEQSSQTFNWTANGHTVQSYQFLIGRSQGSDDLYRSAELSASTLAHTINNFPLSPQTLHITLRYKINNVWEEDYYRYYTPQNAGFDDQFDAGIGQWDQASGTWYNADLQRLSTDVGNDWSIATYRGTEYSDLDFSARVRRSDTDDQPTFLSIRDSGAKVEEDCWCANSGCYTFEISPAQNYAVWSCSGVDWVQLKSIAHSDLINPGTEWNELRVTAIGEELKFYINGSLAWEGNDSTHSSGQVGLGLINFQDSNPNTLDIEWATLTVPAAGN